MSDLFLHAVIAGEQVAIPTAQVDSVIALDVIVPVPGTPPAVRGLSALRSRVVTVVDPAILLGSRHTRGDRAIVVALDGHLYALMVDALDDVTPGDSAPPMGRSASSEAWRAAVSGTVLRDGRAVAVIDPRALVPQLPSATA